MNLILTDYALLVPDLERSIDFYQNKLGLKLNRKDIGFADFKTENAVLALWQSDNVQACLGKENVTDEGHWFMGAFEFQTAEEIKQAYDELKSKGVNFVTDLIDWDWGARAAYFSDPDGYLWEIYAWVNDPYTW